LYLLSPHGAAAATAVDQVRLEVEARLAEEKREKEAKRLAAEQRRAAVVERCLSPIRAICCGECDALCDTTDCGCRQRRRSGVDWRLSYR